MIHELARPPGKCLHHCCSMLAAIQNNSIDFDADHLDRDGSFVGCKLTCSSRLRTRCYKNRMRDRYAPKMQQRATKRPLMVSNVCTLPFVLYESGRLSQSRRVYPKLVLFHSASPNGIPVGWREKLWPVRRGEKDSLEGLGKNKRLSKFERMKKQNNSR